MPRPQSGGSFLIKIKVSAHAPKGQPLSFVITNVETGEVIVKGHNSRVTVDELSDLLYKATGGKHQDDDLAKFKESLHSNKSAEIPEITIGADQLATLKESCQR